MSANESAAVKAEYNSLKSRAQTVMTSATFDDISGELTRATVALASLPAELGRARGRGYAFARYLEQKIEVLTSSWQHAQAQVRLRLGERLAKLRPAVDQLEAVMRKAEITAANPMEIGEVLPVIRGQIQTLEAAVEAGQSHLRPMYETVAQDVHETVAQLQKIHWYCDMKDEASFPFLAGEALFLAAQAEWVNGRGNPDGILYLTDQRLVFEQKEKTGKTLGLFGGKKVQEVEWVLPLAQIERVIPENKGFLGGKDMLNFTLGAGAPFGELVVEVKGGVACKFWAAQIQRMARGEADDERAIAPDPEIVAALRSAPTACPVCGGTLPMIMAGQTAVTCAYCGTVIRI
jgi:hypothetical protein